LVTRPEFVEYLVANATGSAYPAVLPEHFERASVLVPPQEVRSAFEETAVPLMDLLASNEGESRALAATRDALLPKLISGEITVAARDGVADGR
jgi:type I restriction enzyme S subunit